MKTPGQLERARLRREAVQNQLQSFITDALLEIFGEPERDWTICRDDQIERKRRDLEAAAEVFEGSRQKLMNTSQAMQLRADRIRRGNGQAQGQEQGARQAEARARQEYEGGRKVEVYQGGQVEVHHCDVNSAYPAKLVSVGEDEDEEDKGFGDGEAATINEETSRFHRVEGPSPLADQAGEIEARQEQAREDETPRAKPKPARPKK